MVCVHSIRVFPEFLVNPYYEPLVWFMIHDAAVTATWQPGCLYIYDAVVTAAWQPSCVTSRLGM